jgi:phage terminase large subunit-like protein
MREQVLQLPEHLQREFLDSLSMDELAQIAREEWWWTARPEQIPPLGDWSVFLYLAGRGTGKTKMGSEWIVDRTLRFPYDASGFPTERMVLAYNLSDSVATCLEGPSGVLRVLQRRGYHPVERGRSFEDPETKYLYVKSPKPYVKLLGTGAVIHFSGASPDAPRSKNLADALLDEPIKWRDPELVWREGLRPALRADIPGDKPRALVTTTPKPIRLLRDWVNDPDKWKVHIVRGSTFDNAHNLSPDALRELLEMYEGTTLGRQEIYGELLDDVEGALFSFHSIDDHRVELGPEKVAHRCVGVDPGLTGDEDGDEMGVVVTSRDHRDHMYVLADKTVKLAGRDGALHAWKVFDEFQCDTLVYESNLGKAWMEQVFTDAFRELQRAGLFPMDIMSAPLVAVHSNHGKKLRAEPVAMRYSQGRVHHIGHFPKLEDQMLTFDPLSSKASPDRLDALVHACRHLMSGERRGTRIMSPLTLQMRSLEYEAPAAATPPVAEFRNGW